MYHYPTGTPEEAGPHKICKSVYQRLFVCLLFGWSVCSVHTVGESMGDSLQTATYYNRDTSAELKHQVTHTACNLHAFLCCCSWSVPVETPPRSPDHLGGCFAACPSCRTTTASPKPPFTALQRGGRHRGRRRKYWMDNVEEWTPLPLPELNTMASRGEELMSISR